MKNRILRVFFRHSIPLLLTVFLLGGGVMVITNRFVVRETRDTMQSDLEQIQAYYEVILEEMDSLNLMFSTNPRIMARLAELLERDYLDLTDYRDSQMIQSYISSQANARPYIDSIYVYLPNHHQRVLTSGSGLIPLQTMTDTAWYESYVQKQAASPDTPQFWVEAVTLGTSAGAESTKPVLRIYRSILDSVGRAKGVIILNLLKNRLSQSYPLQFMDEGQFLTIEDESGQPLISIPESKQSMPRRDIATFSLTSDRFGWVYTMGVPNRYLHRLSRTIVSLTLFLAVVSCVLGMWLTYRTMARERKFLQTLLDQFQAAGADGMESVEPREGEDLFEFISGRLLQTFIEQDYLKVQKEAIEYRALQIQINPHFLFNVLETINWKAIRLLNAQNDISRMISLVSKILKYSMDMRNSVDVSLVEEIAHTKYYLEIQSYRFPDRYAVSWSVDPGMDACRTPRLLLQPILENCFNHGFSDTGAVLHISIGIHRRGAAMEVIIRDDGQGIQPEVLVALETETAAAAQQGETPIGIPNVRKRLHLLYGGSAGMTIISTPGVGTEVLFSIPLEIVAPHPLGPSEREGRISGGLG